MIIVIVIIIIIIVILIILCNPTVRSNPTGLRDVVRGLERVAPHRLPNGVRTNVVFAEVPQYTIIMA